MHRIIAAFRPRFLIQGLAIIVPLLPSFFILHSSFSMRFVRWAFQRFYREFSWTYDAVAFAVSRGYWQRWTLAALPFLRGRVLEVGCGTGYMQLALAQKQRTAVGLDASIQMLGHSRRRLRRARLVAPLVRAVSQRLPFREQTYDSVLATFPTEYIVHPHTLAEIQRVLASEGRLVIVDAASFIDDGPYERLVDLAYTLTFQRPVRASADPSLPDLSTDPRFSRLHDAGFTTEVHWVTVERSRVMVLVAYQTALDT